jgi:hypothetical protein
MKNHILTYNQLNESNELDNLSFEEVGRLVDLGILDEDLLKIYNYVKNGCIGDLNLVYSTLTHLPSWLVEVEGDLILTNSNIEEIPDSLILHSGIIAENSKLKVFNRKYVNGHLDLDNCKITKLPDHLIINGYLSVRGIQFEEIPKNLRIKRNLFIRSSNLEQFSDEELYKMYTIDGGIAR